MFWRFMRRMFAQSLRVITDPILRHTTDEAMTFVQPAKHAKWAQRFIDQAYELHPAAGVFTQDVVRGAMSSLPLSRGSLELSRARSADRIQEYMTDSFLAYQDPFKVDWNGDGVVDKQDEEAAQLMQVYPWYAKSLTNRAIFGTRPRSPSAQAVTEELTGKTLTHEAFALPSNTILEGVNMWGQLATISLAAAVGETTKTRAATEYARTIAGMGSLLAEGALEGAFSAFLPLQVDRREEVVLYHPGDRLLLGALSLIPGHNLVRVETSHGHQVYKVDKVVNSLYRTAGVALSFELAHVADVVLDQPVAKHGWKEGLFRSTLELLKVVSFYDYNPAEVVAGDTRFYNQEISKYVRVHGDAVPYGLVHLMDEFTPAIDGVEVVESPR